MGKGDDIWVQALALKVDSKARWKWYLKKKYGLTPAQHLKMVEEQGGKCAICGRKVKLNIDHNHKTGKVRGLLCKSCNYRLVGTIEKNIALAIKAISYLKRHK